MSVITKHIEHMTISKTLFENISISTFMQYLCFPTASSICSGVITTPIPQADSKAGTSTPPPRWCRR